MMAVRWMIVAKGRAVSYENMGSEGEPHSARSI
jgi:hypothetical protein